MIQERITINEKDNIFYDTYIITDPLSRNRKRPMIVVCPGGGYTELSPREAEPIALAFNAAGFHAVVLYYSLKKLYPAALKDLSETVCSVRDNADKWCVDTDKIIVCGFSAGGHLAASLGVLWNTEKEIYREDKKNRPNGMILAYPVITSGRYSHRGSIENITNWDDELVNKVSLEDHVRADAAPAFIWHTFNDTVVPVENSLYLAESLSKAKVPTELHIFPNGPHGLSLANELVATDADGIVQEAQQWIDMAIRWVQAL